ncbi:MAG: hypothetical protein FWF95_03795 [Syntrophorhabdaceae bacterium]|nr:hypothetical protein [Syntrophorhabdaceae bacterium]
MKKILFLILTLIFVFLPSYSQAQPKSKAEVEALLKDFMIGLANEQTREKYSFMQIVCNDGYYYEFIGDGHNDVKGEVKAHNIAFADFAKNKLYELDVNKKTYIVESLDPAEKAMLRRFDPMLGTHLFVHASHMQADGFKKTGKSEKIAGRKASVYTMAFNDGTTATFWIDDEYGFTLKYVQDGKRPIYSEVIKFTTSGVTVKGLLNLDGYKLVKE